MKLSFCTVVKNDTFYLRMMIKSIIDIADEIIIVDDNSVETDFPHNERMIKEFNSDKIKYFRFPIGNEFGKARQYAHNQATGDWIFWLDADEVLHEKEKINIKKIIEEGEKRGANCFHVEYIHFIENFSKIDNSLPLHIGILRIYKNYKEIKFAGKNHAVPNYHFKIILCPQIKIWHLGYMRGMDKILERFDRNFNYSEMHLPLQQVKWRDWHYFGEYPTKPIDIRIIPEVIIETFMMKVGGGYLA